jgi:hypothetical protein
MLTDAERLAEIDHADAIRPSITYAHVIQLAGYLAASVEDAAIDGDPLIGPEDWVGHVENGLVAVIGVDEVATKVQPGDPADRLPDLPEGIR